jgi:hypothetical protein
MSSLSSLSGLGVIMVAALLGTSACARDPLSAETGGETTSMSSNGTTDTETSQSSSMTDSEDEVTTNMSSPGSFYAPPSDFAWTAECDPWMQDCPEGEKCMPYSDDGVTVIGDQCVPIVGNGQLGDPCVSDGIVEGTDDCGEGLMCWPNDGSEASCHSFCTMADNPTCEMGTSCVVYYEFYAPLCVPSCDPLLQDCEAGSACHWGGDVFECMPETANLQLGEACGGVDECGAGLTCIDAAVLPDCAGASCCAAYCDVMAPDCQQMGTECVQYFDPSPPAYENVGVCVVPPP